jgi:hypothetical protein
MKEHGIFLYLDHDSVFAFMAGNLLCHLHASAADSLPTMEKEPPTPVPEKPVLLRKWGCKRGIWVWMEH